MYTWYHTNILHITLDNPNPWQMSSKTRKCRGTLVGYIIMFPSRDPSVTRPQTNLLTNTVPGKQGKPDPNSD